MTPSVGLQAHWGLLFCGGYGFSAKLNPLSTADPPRGGGERRRKVGRRARLAVAIGALLSACSPSARPGPTPTATGSSANPATESPALDQNGWGELVSRRFSVAVALPSAARWTVDDQHSPWLVATDRATGSVLRLRAWRASRRVRPADCEAEARTFGQPLPEPRPENSLEQTELDVPPGWRTRVVSAVRSLPNGGEIEGTVLAFGATTGRCLAFVYMTHDVGPEAVARVGQRLAVVVEGMVQRLHWRGVEERELEARPER